MSRARVWLKLALGLLVLGVVLLLTPPVRTNLGSYLPWAWFTRDWILFDIPRQPLVLTGEVLADSKGVRICNRTSARWKDVVVRITSEVSTGVAPPFETPFFAKTQTITSGECRDILASEFSSASWKKIPAPSRMNIVRVEVLASVQGTGYLDTRIGPSAPR